MPGPGEVLVVDGDDSIRRLLEVVVRLLPREPIAAADGRSALQLLSSRGFDAVVLDLILPELSGSEILRFLASGSPELLRRTIVLTTLPESRWPIDEMRGCALVLRKPFSLEELVRALRTCCDGDGDP